MYLNITGAFTKATVKVIIYVPFLFLFAPRF